VLFLRYTPVSRLRHRFPAMADSVPSERTPSERAERAAADRGERTPPHNLDAERSVLGGILIRNETYNHAAAIIDSGDFYRDAHRRIFDAMVELNERGDAIDLITLKEALTRTQELEDVGGVAYLARLVDGVPRATNVEHYATIVKEKSTLRALITRAQEILQEAYAGAEDAEEILDSAERRIFEVADKRIRTGFVPIADLVQDSFDTLSKLQQHRGLVSGVPTGFTELDEMTSGLQAGDMIIIAARPSMGKTSFVLNIAQHVALNRERRMTVGFFSLEMSAPQLFIRLLTAEARIDAHRLRSGYLSADDYAKLVKAVGTLETARIFIDDTASIGVLEMRAKARRLKAEHGLHLLIIDYLQLMTGRGRFDNRQQELASISRSLKGLAKELGVPILVLSQLSRAPEARSDRRPQLSDLRESGALEQDADVVMMIFRPGVYEKDNPDLQNVAEIIIAKQRNGPIGTANLAFLGQYTLFANIEQGMA
jgi:replicative DNA helicase